MTDSALVLEGRFGPYRDASGLEGLDVLVAYQAGGSLARRDEIPLT